MNKRNGLIILITLIILLIVIPFGIVFRKMIILRDISEKQIKVQGMLDNYHQKFTSDSDKFSIVADIYAKGDKSIMFSTVTLKETEEDAKSIIYSDNLVNKVYIEKGKEELINEYGFVVSSQSVSYNYENCNFIDLFKIANEYSIKSTVFNGKKCYIIDNKKIQTNAEYPEVYVEKQTGLILMSMGNVNEYEFGNVDDKIFDEIDLSIYELQGDTVGNEETITPTEVVQKDVLLDNISYIEIEVEDETSLEGIQYTAPIRIEKNNKVMELIGYINESKEITDFDEVYGAGDFFEGTPIATFYSEKGEKVIITAIDNFAEDENGEFINIIGYTTNEESYNEKIYKTNYNVAEFMKKLYEENK